MRERGSRSVMRKRSGFIVHLRIVVDTRIVIQVRAAAQLKVTDHFVVVAQGALLYVSDVRFRVTRWRIDTMLSLVIVTRPRLSKLGRPESPFAGHPALGEGPNKFWKDTGEAARNLKA
jgi:hypothetical protein